MWGIKRKTKYESRFHPKMGELNCKVTRVYKTIFGVPYREVHAYRETYYGEVKDLDNCNLKK